MGDDCGLGEGVHKLDGCWRRWCSGRRGCGAHFYFKGNCGHCKWLLNRMEQLVIRSRVETVPYAGVLVAGKRVCGILGQ